MSKAVDYLWNRIQLGDEKEILLQSFRPEEWNSIRIVCVGPVISYYINGIMVSELVDNGPDATSKGWIALQMHQGPPMKVQYKNIYLKEL